MEKLPEPATGLFPQFIRSGIVLALFACALLCPSSMLGQPAKPTVEELWRDASVAQQAQQYVRAASLYRQILAQQPDLTEAEVNLGLMLHLAGNLKDAIASFEHVLAVHPDLFVPNFLTGMDYLKLDNPVRALPFLERATREKPDQIEARVGLANSYLQLGNFLQALQQFTRATQLNARNADAWYGLGATYLSIEKQIEGDLRHTASPYRTVLLGESYLQQGQTEKAVAALTAAVAAQPAVPCSHSILGFALLRTSRFDDAIRQFHFDWNSRSGQGCLLSKLGMIVLDAEKSDSDNALRSLREAFEVDPAFVRLNQDWYLNDVMKAGLERPARAILDDYPSSDSIAATSQSPATLMRGGRYSACSAALAKPSAPKTMDDLRIQSLCSYYAGRDDLVLNATEHILKRSPDDPEALYWRVQSMERTGLAALTQGSQLNPESASLHALLGDMLRAKGDLAGAATEYRQAIAANPDFLAAHLGLARDLYSDHRAEDAEHELQSVLKANSDDPEANYLMGEILVNREALASALPFLIKALRVSPEELPYVHADLSRIYEDCGDINQAIAEMKLAVPVDVDGSYYYRLGHLYMRSGDRSSAAIALDQAAKLRHATDAAALFQKER